MEASVCTLEALRLRNSDVDGSSSGGDEDPILEVKTVQHSAGTINRIRV